MKLAKIVAKNKRKIIGLMSGTSCDGLDIALIEISGFGIETKYRMLHCKSTSYTKTQKKYLLQLMSSDGSNVIKISQANFYLAKIWAVSVNDFLENIGINSGEIDLIGSHGQTIYHHPVPTPVLGENISSTFQIGDPSVLAQLTGIITVGDFRVADVALGGQGAPLVPYFDWLSFARQKKNSLILNIGGIANFTFIPADGKPDGIIAFDTGPGNMLIDQLMQRLYECPLDKDGEVASHGEFSQRLFDYLIKSDPFPAMLPPKSTGREHYGKEFVVALLKKAVRWRISEPSIIHTISKYTPFTIWQAYDKFIDSEIDQLLVGGGGVHNKLIMDTLGQYFQNVDLKNICDAGIDEDYKEAICFAVLANECIHEAAAGLPNVTGARNPAVLGKICLV